MESKKLFFYELEGRGYIFQNKKWDETKHGFEDDMLNMAWEMWSSGQATKAQVPEGFVLVPREPTPKMIDATWNFDEEIQNMSHNSRNEFIYKAMIEALEPTND